MSEEGKNPTEPVVYFATSKGENARRLVMVRQDIGRPVGFLLATDFARNLFYLDEFYDYAKAIDPLATEATR